MAGEFLEVRGDIVRSKDVKNIPGDGGFAGLAMGDMRDLFAGGDEAFGDQETKCEFGIVAGSPHGDGDTLALQADLQRLLNSDGIIARGERTSTRHLGDKATLHRCVIRFSAGWFGHGWRIPIVWPLCNAGGLWIENESRTGYICRTNH